MLGWINKASASNPNQNDMLYALRRDGDIILDDKVRQEAGMVLSDRYMMAVPNENLVQLVEWIRGDSYPIAKGNVFFLAEEPRHPTEDSMIINRFLPAAYNLAVIGKSQMQLDAQRKKRILLTVLGSCIAVAFLIVFAIIPLARPPQLISIPDSVIQQISEEQNAEQMREVEDRLRKAIEEQNRLSQEALELEDERNDIR